MGSLYFLILHLLHSLLHIGFLFLLHKHILIFSHYDFNVPYFIFYLIDHRFSFHVGQRLPEIEGFLPETYLLLLVVKLGTLNVRL